MGTIKASSNVQTMYNNIVGCVLPFAKVPSCGKKRKIRHKKTSGCAVKCSNVSTTTDLFSVRLFSSLSEILLFCNGERALTSIKSTWLKAGTHQTDTRRTAGTGRLEGPNPDGLILCELAPNTLIIIRVKRRSSLSWLTWPEARPRMTPKTLLNNSPILYEGDVCTDI